MAELVQTTNSTEGIKGSKVSWLAFIFQNRRSMNRKGGIFSKRLDNGSANRKRFDFLKF